MEPTGRTGQRLVAALRPSASLWAARLGSARGSAGGPGGPAGVDADAAVPAMSSAVRALAGGFEAQAAGRFNEALHAYRTAQRSRSPLLKALGGNAEGLLLLRTPVSLTTADTPGNQEGLKDESKSAAFGEIPVVGDFVVAPWAEDGAEYSGTVAAVDIEAGVCTVNWADGGKTHRVVPLAAVTTLQGSVYACAAGSRETEVRAWVVRRTLRHSLDAWHFQAESGTAHDAYVDYVGLLCDTALAELRATLGAAGRRWLAEGISHARRHLQRARWTAERAYAPDARALLVVCTHRTELLRLTAAAATADSSSSSAPKPAASENPRESLKEALSLHQRAAFHVATAKWERKQAARWQRPGGGLAPEVLHELLWAKTLASLASLRQPRAEAVHPKGRPRPKGRQHPASASRAAGHGGGRAAGPRTASERRAWTLPRNFQPATPEGRAWALPEKLLPATPALPAAADVLMSEACPARASAARAWRALSAAAGKPTMEGWPALKAASGEDARCLAELIEQLSVNSPNTTGSRLLLEVAVLIFTMGCRLGRTSWAREIAFPLAEAAERQLAAAEAVDDSPAAARLTLAALASPLRPQALCSVAGAPSPLGSSRAEVLRNGVKDQTSDSEAIVERPPVRCRWRVARYSAIDEIWVLALGSRHLVHLAAPPPLTWCMEGLALSETAPEPAPVGSS